MHGPGSGVQATPLRRWEVQCFLFDDWALNLGFIRAMVKTPLEGSIRINRVTMKGLLGFF